MYSRSYNTGLAVAGMWLLVSLVLVAAGCAPSGRTIYPEPDPGRSARGQLEAPYFYPIVAQKVTSESLGALLDHYRGKALVLCVWSVYDPVAVPALHHVRQVQARYGGSRILAINLDPPASWRDKAVPALKAARTRFPCVVVPESEQPDVLQRLGLNGRPRSVTYVVLDAAGQQQRVWSAFEPGDGSPIATVTDRPSEAKPSGDSRVAGEPPGGDQPSPEAPPTSPAERQLAVGGPAGDGAADPDKLPHVRSAAEAGPAAEGGIVSAGTQPLRDARLLYRLRVVQMSDGSVVNEATGMGWLKDVTGPADSGDTPAWLKQLALNLDLTGGRGGQALAVAVPGWTPSGEGGPPHASAFAQAVSAALREAGISVMGPEAVAKALQSRGMAPRVLQMRPGALHGAIDADRILVGEVTVLAEP